MYSAYEGAAVSLPAFPKVNTMTCSSDINLCELRLTVIFRF